MAENLAMLRSAIADARPLVLTTRTAAGPRELHVRLVRGAGGDEGFWAELVRGDGKLIDRMIASEMVVRATLNAGPVQAAFDTVLHQRRRSLLKADRVLLGWPSKVSVSERRKAPREPIPQEMPLTAAIRRDEAAGGGSSPPVPVADLSTTGACLLYSRGVQPPAFQPHDLLHLTFTAGGAQHRMTARYRHAQSTPGGVRVGVEFDQSGCSAEATAWLQACIEEARACRIRRSLKTAFDRSAA